MKRKLLAFSFLLLILGTIPAYGEDPSTETSSLTTDSSPIGQKLGEVTHTPTTSSAKMEGEGFSSPEEAAAAYISGLQENNISKMISAFAVETYAENYSLNQMVERLSAYMPSLGYIPPISEFSLQLNTEERRSAIVDAIKGHYLVLTGSGAVLGENAGIAVPLNEYSSSDELLVSLFVSDDTPYLSQIRFEEEFIDPATLNPNYTSDIVQKNMQELANIVNADDIVSVAAKLYSGNNTYLLGMDAAKFNDKWYLLNAQGYIATLLNTNTYQYGMIPLDAPEMAEIRELIE